MNKSEEKIYNEIIERMEYKERRNKYLQSLYKLNIRRTKASVFYEKEYTYLDYLDGRKNLLSIDLYCRYTGEKVNKNKIKKALKEYFDNK